MGHKIKKINVLTATFVSALHKLPAKQALLRALNSLSLARLMKSSTFDLGQSAIYGNGRQYINGPQNKKN